MDADIGTNVVGVAEFGIFALISLTALLTVPLGKLIVILKLPRYIVVPGFGLRITSKVISLPEVDLLIKSSVAL